MAAESRRIEWSEENRDIVFARLNRLRAPLAELERTEYAALLRYGQKGHITFDEIYAIACRVNKTLVDELTPANTKARADAERVLAMLKGLFAGGLPLSERYEVSATERDRQRLASLLAMSKDCFCNTPAQVVIEQLADAFGHEVLRTAGAGDLYQSPTHVGLYRVVLGTLSYWGEPGNMLLTLDRLADSVRGYTGQLHGLLQTQAHVVHQLDEALRELCGSLLGVPMVSDLLQQYANNPRQWLHVVGTFREGKAALDKTITHLDSKVVPYRLGQMSVAERELLARVPAQLAAMNEFVLSEQR